MTRSDIADGQGAHERGSLSARFESTALGRIVLSGVIVYVLVALLVTNLPSSELKTTASPPVKGFLEATALRQGWTLFAPNPRRQTLRLQAHLVYDDGTRRIWTQPSGDPALGTYRSYRWRKLTENMVSDRRSSSWPDLARWVAETNRVDGRLPVEVSLVRQSYLPPPLGSGEREVPDWSDRILFTARYLEEQPR